MVLFLEIISLQNIPIEVIAIKLLFRGFIVDILWNKSMI